MDITHRRAPRSWRAIGIVCALIAATSSCAPANGGPGAETAPLPPTSVVLRWRYPPGAELVYVQSMVNQTEMPQGMGTSTSRMEFTQRWSVLEPGADGNTRVRLTTDRVRFGVETPMGTIEADSAEESGSGTEGLEAMTAMAGTSYVLVLDEQGALVDIEGVEELRQRLRGASSNPLMATMFDQTLSKENLSNGLQQSIFGFPRDAVEIGDSWQQQFTQTMPMVGALVTTTTLTLESIARPDGSTIAVISSNGDIAIDSAAAGGVMSARVNDASTSGTLEFDVVRGRMVRSQTTMGMEMTMSMGGREIAIGSQATVTIELQESGG